MPGASDRGPVLADEFASKHLASHGQLPRRARREQDKEQDKICAILEKLNGKKDARSGAHHTLRSGAENSIVPNTAECNADALFLAGRTSLEHTRNDFAISEMLSSCVSKLCRPRNS
jgi:hypothetical protein